MKTLSLSVPLANGDDTVTQILQDGWGYLEYAGNFGVNGKARPSISWDGGVTYHRLKDQDGLPIEAAAAMYVYVAIAGEPLLRNTVAEAAGAVAITCKLHYGSVATKPR